jgi:hypothetical protein
MNWGEAAPPQAGIFAGATQAELATRASVHAGVAMSRQDAGATIPLPLRPRQARSRRYEAAPLPAQAG